MSEQKYEEVPFPPALHSSQENYSAHHPDNPTYFPTPCKVMLPSVSPGKIILSLSLKVGGGWPPIQAVILTVTLKGFGGGEFPWISLFLASLLMLPFCDLNHIDHLEFLGKEIGFIFTLL